MEEDTSIPSVLSFQPTGLLVFELHAETETEKRNPTETMHAALWEECFRNLVKQWDSGKPRPKLLSDVGRLYHPSKANEEIPEQIAKEEEIQYSTFMFVELY